MSKNRTKPSSNALSLLIGSLIAPVNFCLDSVWDYGKGKKNGIAPRQCHFELELRCFFFTVVDYQILACDRRLFRGRDRAH